MAKRALASDVYVVSTDLQGTRVTAKAPDIYFLLVMEGKALDVEVLQDCVTFDLFVKDKTGKAVVAVVVHDSVPAEEANKFANQMVDVQGRMKGDGLSVRFFGLTNFLV